MSKRNHIRNMPTNTFFTIKTRIFFAVEGIWKGFWVSNRTGRDTDQKKRFYSASLFVGCGRRTGYSQGLRWGCTTGVGEKEERGEGVQRNVEREREREAATGEGSGKSIRDAPPTPAANTAMVLSCKHANSARNQGNTVTDSKLFKQAVVMNSYETISWNLIL